MMYAFARVVLTLAALAGPAAVGGTVEEQLAQPSQPSQQPPSQQSPAPQQIGQQAANQMGTDSLLEARTSALAAQLRCPVCQGLSIQDSPSELSQQMRSLVRDQLAEGKTPEQVKAYFISKYGEWILLEPEAKGFNSLVYLLPLLLVVGGGVVIVVVVRRWTSAGASAASASPADSIGPSDSTFDD